MDTLFNKLQQAYMNMQEEKLPTEWYHGSPTPIQKFSDDFVGQGVDQEGPGIYFTSNEEDAYGYARKSENGTGVVYVVGLDFKKIVPLKGRANKKDIMQLIDWAPNLETLLTNYDDNPTKAKAIAFGHCMRQDNPHQSFQQVWYDFYRHEPVDFVRNMVTLGYDGVVVPRQFMNTKHAVVYNPKIIRLIDQR
jgi:hypothetical protein